MKAKDFDIDFSSGCMTCCYSHIEEIGDEEVKLGSVTECEHCGVAMRLENVGGKKLMWRAYKK
jgi:hypothetical protein